MTTVNEVAPNLYRISLYLPAFDMQFNHFLIMDEEPMLYHTGMRSMFPMLKEALAKVVAPEKLRWIGFSHFEVDECGALNEWLSVAPHAQAICSEVGALVNMSDFALRPARGLSRADVLNTGKYSFSFIPTPHLPHGWDAGVLFEQNSKTLLCSDLFHQDGNVTAITDKDIMERVRTSLRAGQQTPLSDYMPYTHKTAGMLQELAALQPNTLATMHGSSYNGNCAQALLDLNIVMKEELGEENLLVKS